MALSVCELPESLGVPIALSAYRPGRIEPGAQELSSAHLNEGWQEIHRLGKMTGTEGIEILQTASGPSIGLRMRDRLIPARAASGGISGRSGSSVGTGFAKFIKSDRDTITESADEVKVYNWLSSSFAEGDDLYLDWWQEAYWAVPVTAGTGTQSSRCRCPGDVGDYLVEVQCGACASVYGPNVTMPKFWILTIISSTTNPYADPACEGVTCADLQGVVIELENELDFYSNPTCVWSGVAMIGAICFKAELTIGDEIVTLRILDADDCVIATLTMSTEDFLCCGVNTAWTQGEDDTCDVTVRLEPHECTCCPEEPICPPPGRVPCRALFDLCGCGRGKCSMAVTVSSLATPPGSEDDPLENCGAMNGAYVVVWVSDCEWYVEGGLGGADAPDTAVHVVFDGEFTITLFGPTGQVAVHRTDGYNCEETPIADFVPGESTCLLGGTASIGIV